MKRLVGIVAVCLGVVVATWYLIQAGSADPSTLRSVRVTRGTVVRKATAVGRIEVENEVPVKSLNGGILTELFARSGQIVEKGQALAEVRPVATEQTLLQAERALEQAREGEESAREYVEGEHLAGWAMRMFVGQKNLERMHKNAALGRKQTEEQLELLRQGEVSVEGRRVDYIVRAPISGHVLEIRQREGSPVVPSSSYGSGTVFMTLADMSRLIFRGTVDEIDVGRLKEEMTVDISIGALPGVAVAGRLTEIGLKGLERNNAVVFPVTIQVEVPENVVLRSGYSAVAEIVVDRRDDVPVIPERLVSFREGRAFVQVPDGAGGRTEKEVTAGLSDGMTVEILQGLSEGETVLEPVYD